jgi:hypothetical protein
LDKGIKIEFDEPSHKYKVNGVYVPGVTEVLQSVGIIDYSFLDERTKQIALSRGRVVHQICEYDDLGDLGSYDLRLEPYLEAWRKFKADFHFVPETIEKISYNRLHGYIGRIDRTGRTKDLDKVVLEIKTSVTPPWWTRYQLAAYGATHFGVYQAPDRIAVSLREDGTYHAEAYDSFSQDFSLFISALSIHRRKIEHERELAA